MISKKKYDKLLILHLEKAEDSTAQYLADVLQYIDKKSKTPNAGWQTLKAILKTQTTIKGELL